MVVQGIYHYVFFSRVLTKWKCKIKVHLYLEYFLPTGGHSLLLYVWRSCHISVLGFVRDFLLASKFSRSQIFPLNVMTFKFEHVHSLPSAHWMNLDIFKCPSCPISSNFNSICNFHTCAAKKKLAAFEPMGSFMELFALHSKQPMIGYCPTYRVSFSSLGHGALQIMLHNHATDLVLPALNEVCVCVWSLFIEQRFKRMLRYSDSMGSGGR